MRFIVIMFALSTPAFAEFNCLPLETLKLKVEICEENFTLGKLADSCLNKFTNEISGTKPLIDKGLAKNTQTNSMQSASNVYDQAIKEVDRLIANGENSKLAVDSYLANIFMPEDSDKPSLLGMSTEAYLKTEPCYATPHKVMSEDSDMIQILVLDLKKKREALLAARGSAQANKKDLGTSSTQTAIVNGQKTSAPAAKAIDIKGSGISGTITDGKSKKVQEQEKK